MHAAVIPGIDVAAVTLESGVTMYHGVEFAIVDGFRPLVLDLYRPVPTTPVLGAVVYIHGGGWRVGTRRRFGRSFKSWNPSALDRVAQAGLVVATVDYRLSAEAPFPAMLHDVKAAVRWLRARSDVLGFHPQAIAAWGESAGGHLALMLGVSAGLPALDGTVGDDTALPSDVTAVAAWYPPTDLVRIGEQTPSGSASDPDSAGSWESMMVGAPLHDNPGAAAAASPITYAAGGAETAFHIHHGTADSVVPFAQSETMVDELAEAGAEVTFVPVEGAEHFWSDVADLEGIFDTTLRWVVARLSPFG